jgi:hypothetical protein
MINKVYRWALGIWWIPAHGLWGGFSNQKQMQPSALSVFKYLNYLLTATIAWLISQIWCFG